MVQKISVEDGDTSTCSLMAWGYNPFISEKSPYHGAYLAVVERLGKLVATGAEFKTCTDVSGIFRKAQPDPNVGANRWRHYSARLRPKRISESQLSAVRTP